MKIAIIHDYFDEIGGAETTLLYMARVIKAEIFTTNVDNKKIRELGFPDIKIKSIGKAPKIKIIKQIITRLRFYFFNLKGFDFYILGGVSSIYASHNLKPNFWFCFSPNRNLYDLRYFKTKNPIIQFLKELMIIIDKNCVKKIDRIVCNSANTKKRVEKYYKNIYKETPQVVHSPVDTSIFKNDLDSKYWLMVNRIDSYKRIELAIETFKKMPAEKLVIVGGAPLKDSEYFKKLVLSATSNIEFKGPIYNTNELVNLYSKCKGFITTAMDEDFGKTPIEAMASGKPVIAPNEGGYKESVINGVTGILIDEITPNKLKEAIEKVNKNVKENPARYKDVCINRAKEFDVKIFIEKIKKSIENYEFFKKDNSR
jgi:glycosyltransferase involved in cell wall biosynthesis